MTLELIEFGERNDDGDLIYRREVPISNGATKTDECNVTKLLTPGKRTTGDVSILVHEARQAAEGEVGNPAYPADIDTANEACRRIIERDGLEPAWKDHEPEAVV